MATNEIKLLIKTLLQDKQFQKGIKGMDKGFKKTEKTSSGFFKKMKVGWLALTAAIAGIGVAMVKFLKVGADFEKAIARVRAVSGGTTKELAKLARQAGKTTVFSAKQAADALYFLASAGLAVRDMSKVLTPALNLAAAGNLEIAEATDIVVNNLKIFGAEMSEAEKFTDIMAVTVKSANTDMRQLSEALRTAAPIAATAGIGFEDLNIILAAMADRGIKGARAGTQLRMALARLIKPTEEAKIALKKYNISIDEISKLLPTPIKLFKRLNEANLSNIDALKILGVRQSGIFSLIKEGMPTIDKLSKKMENYDGVAKQMAKTQITTVGGALKLLKSIWEELILSITMGAMPALQDFILGIVDMVSNIGDWVKGGEDMEDVTASLIDLQTEYNEIIKTLTDSQKKLTTAEEQNLKVRKSMLELNIIQELNKTNKIYDEQVKKLKNLSQEQANTSFALIALRHKLIGATEETVVLTEAEAKLIGATTTAKGSMRLFGGILVETKTALDLFTEAQENAKQSTVAYEEQKKKLFNTVNMFAQALIDEQISDENLIGLNETLKNQILERVPLLLDEMFIREEAARKKEENTIKEIESNEVKKTSVKDYYSFLGMQRELALLKEQESLKKASDFLAVEHEKEKRMLKDMLDAKKINQDEYWITLRESQTAHNTAMAELMEQHNKNLVLKNDVVGKALADSWKGATDKIANDWGEGMAKMLIDGEILKMNLGDIAKELVSEFGRLLIKILAVKAAKALLTGGLGLFFSGGGLVPDLGNMKRMVYAQAGTMAKGTDTVPAMLTPGERVLPVNQARAFDSLVRSLAIPAMTGGAPVTNNNQSENVTNINNEFNNEFGSDGVDSMLEMSQNMNSELFRR